MPGFKVNMKLKAVCVRPRQHNSRPSVWHHHPTDLNVADDITKGISPEELNGRWFKEDLSPKELGLIDVKEVERRGERFVHSTRSPPPRDQKRKIKKAGIRKPIKFPSALFI